jgi:Fic family protein
LHKQLAKKAFRYAKQPMKLPRHPPSLTDIWTGISPDRLIQLISLMNELEADPKYLHWDELYHRQPSPPMTREEWWFGLKMRRRPAKSIPLLDIDGKPFSFNVPGSVQEGLHRIDLNAGGSVEASQPALEPITNPVTRKRYLMRSLMEEAITSSQLEGAATTREVARDMIRQKRQPKDRGERMILNNFLTMQHVGQLREQPLSQDLIFEIHRLVTQDTLDDPTAAGRPRNDNEYRVVGDEFGEVFHRTPPASQLESRMAAMCEFANGRTPEGFIHPAIRSILLHFWLAYDHPFPDGNGRTARALFYWSMLRHRYWLFEYASISQIILRGPARYGRAFLHTETDDNDLTYFIIYNIEVIIKAIEELFRYIDHRGRELRALDVSLRGMAELNNRQRDLIKHALRNLGFQYTIETHRNSHDVVYETARSDLDDLVNRGLLVKRRMRRAFVFFPVADLEEGLRRDG